MPKVVGAPYPNCEDNMEQNLPTNVNPDVCELEESKQPKIRDYQLESARLESFKNWPCVWVKPEKLAAAGFYYAGTDDKVKCFECQLEISELKLKDDPVTFHKQRSPKCRFIRGDSCGNVPKNVNLDTVPTVSRVGDVCGPSDSIEKSRSASEMKHPRYADISERLLSFAMWPKEQPALTIRLAGAGFYYTQKSDQTICYQCGLELKDWEVDDDPLKRHTELYRECPQLRKFVCVPSDSIEKSRSASEMKHPSYADISQRLLSFAMWPKEQPALTIRLALAGFYYTQKSDQTICYQCGLELKDWEVDDDPWKRHTELYRECPQFRKFVCVPYDSIEKSRSASEMKHPRYADFSERLASFAIWPKMLESLIIRLAAAGFYYTQKSDETICYQCGLELKDWEVDDDPWKRHTELYRECPQLRKYEEWVAVAKQFKKL